MKLLPHLACFFAVASLGMAETSARGVARIQGFEKSPDDQPSSQSLGFVVERAGFILTNYQGLVQPGSGRLLEHFKVTVEDKSYPAEIIGVEPTLNLGILKVESTESFEPVVSALKRTAAPGDAIQAVSFAEGRASFIDGQVTALNTKQCYQESLTSTMFRAKITIPMESVGGPVFYADTGEVAAIYTGYKPVPEPGHAENAEETHLLPINLCFNIYDSIKQKKSLRSPWTGFSVRALNEAEQKFFPTAKKHNGGVAIEHVWKDSPAERLGIREGDILVQFAFSRILSVADFQKWLYMYGVETAVKLVILRNETEYLMTDYVIEERPQWARPK